MRKFSFFLVSLAMVFFCDSNPSQPTGDDVFSIYLVKDSNQFYTQEKSPLNEMELEAEPLLSAKEIESYKWSNHLISFPESTKEKMMQKEPLLHYLFVVVANGERIYWGMFLDDADSFASDSPVIRLLPRNPAGSAIPSTFVIDNGYPGATENDIRPNPKIYKALKNAGKLTY